jgi:hypothetical protein
MALRAVSRGGGGGGGGGGVAYTTTKTANYTANANDGVLTNTTGGAFTVTLPAAPTNGQQVIVADAGGDWGTNNLTVGRNGNNIADLAQDLVCDINGASVQFVYNSTAPATWEVYAQVGGNGGTVVTLNGTQTLTNKTLTAPVLTTPVLGTPASGTLSNLTGLPPAGVVGTAAILGANTFTGAQIGTVTALTSSAAAIAVNLTTNNNFSYTTVENSTLSLPSNPVAGQSGVITITQGATARTLAYNTFWKFAGGTVPTLTATAAAVDMFAYQIESATRATAQLIKDVK